MPAKVWCDHAEGFESGLRAWDGEWERASGTALADAVKYTVTMNLAPILIKNISQLGTYSNRAALRASNVAMVLFIPELWSESDRGSWKCNKRR